jgi:tRNA threonylcarbamoyladenosine biosynthesis protein TsaB
MDTCDGRGSVALLDDEAVFATAVHDSAEDYSTWLLPAVERVLKAAGRKLTDVGIYAAAAGPGSFTGIRIALTTVKAWNEVYGKPIAAVSRLEALAIQAVGPGVKGFAVSPFVAASCDAQRNQLYAAVYRREGQSLHRLGDEAVVSPAELIRWTADQAAGAAVVWASLDPDSLAAEPAWQERAAKGEVVERVPAVLAPAIGKIALQLAARNGLTDALLLDANYIRRPDAEVKWKGYSRPAVAPPGPKVVAHRVRAFQPADATAVAQLAAASPEAAQWTESSYATLLDSGYRAWVVASGSQDASTVTGFLIARTVLPDAEILNLAVAPENRRTGIAAALLEAALSERAAAKVQRVYLEVRASNTAAISFYKKHLFRVTGARPAYYQHPVEDAVLMERVL